MDYAGELVELFDFSAGWCKLELLRMAWGVNIAAYAYDMKWWQHHVAKQINCAAQLNILGFIWELLQLT